LNTSSFLPGVPEGTLAFVGQNVQYPYATGGDGLVVEDVSDYQNRKPNPHIITTDEAGAAGGRPDGWPGACAHGLSPFGFPQIVDIADPANPKVISKLRLEVSDPANCSALLAETPPDV